MTEGERLNRIVDMAKERWNGDDCVVEIGLDNSNMVSESVDNGAWVKAWVWVDFAGTALDKGPQNG